MYGTNAAENGVVPKSRKWAKGIDFCEVNTSNSQICSCEGQEKNVLIELTAEQLYLLLSSITAFARRVSSAVEHSSKCKLLEHCRTNSKWSVSSLVVNNHSIINMWCDSQSPVDAVDELEQSFFNKYIVFLFDVVLTRWSNNKVNFVQYSMCTCSYHGGTNNSL